MQQKSEIICKLTFFRYRHREQCDVHYVKTWTKEICQSGIGFSLLPLSVLF